MRVLGFGGGALVLWWPCQCALKPAGQARPLVSCWHMSLNADSPTHSASMTAKPSPEAEVLASRLHAPDGKLKTIKKIKNMIIGNRSKKRELLHLLPAVLQAMAASQQPELLVQAAITLGSFAYGVEDGVRMIVEQGGIGSLVRQLHSSDERVVQAAMRSLKLIYQVIKTIVISLLRCCMHAKLRGLLGGGMPAWRAMRPAQACMPPFLLAPRPPSAHKRGRRSRPTLNHTAITTPQQQQQQHSVLNVFVVPPRSPRALLGRKCSRRRCWRGWWRCCR